jgi:hypothetical protein
MPSISGPRLSELLRIEKQAKLNREHEAMKPFVEDFVHSLGTLYAFTPWSLWDENAKLAFEHAAKRIPTGAALYRNHLPKE